MKEIIDIKKVLIPSVDGQTGMPTPLFTGFYWITFQQVKIGGDEYVKYEFVPDFVKLCGSENAKRFNRDKIEMLVDKKEYTKT